MLELFGVVILAIVVWIVVRNMKVSRKIKQFFEAAKKGDVSTLTKILDSGFNVNATLNGYTALMVAFINGHDKIIRTLLDKGIDVNIKDNEENTALICATLFNNIEGAKLILDKGVNVNEKNMHGATPLMLAAIAGYDDMVKLLLDNGADQTMTNLNDNRKNALIYAIENKHTDVVKLLINDGADVNCTDYEDNSALFYAVVKGNIDIARMLLDKGAYEGKKAAFLYAIENGDYDLVKLLLEHGADVKAKTSNGESTLMLATKQKDKRIVELLKSYQSS